MEYKKVLLGAKTDRTWNAEKTNDYIEGRYIEKNENIGQNKSNMYVLEAGNEKVGVWGSTVIDSQMSRVAIGKMVKIIYLGQEKSDKTGRIYKNFEVWEGIDKAGDEVPEADIEDINF
ncbi:MAG: hypothetical protein QMD65_02115 [Patescibacteria group bacterium]|nr:hypothetical protein [Patescibacteria group bacterium]